MALPKLNARAPWPVGPLCVAAAPAGKHPKTDTWSARAIFACAIPCRQEHPIETSRRQFLHLAAGAARVAGHIAHREGARLSDAAN